MGNKLEGKAAVVTGAGRGIGRAIALELAKEGARVVVNDLGTGRSGEGTDVSPAEEVVSEIKKNGGEAVPNADSVADFTAAGRMIQSCIDNFGRIDILVNVAGILRDRMVHKMSEEEWDAVINVHLKGTFTV
ncbi:MAG: SDR family NAD(P)-dependent oxidoreductase [Deltaproteobacteria bacterium]|nr:SDR family NAD(P)-dependent oxidoreductase [Deltaproteobacteria bacterium]